MKTAAKKFKEVANDLYRDMYGCLSSSKAVDNIKLPDGRDAQIIITIETEEDNFIDITPQ